MKRVLLPRLDLMAAYLLSKLINFIFEALKMKIMQYLCWSHSLVTLGWIRCPNQNWKTFVANRIQTIQENVAPDHYRFCPRDLNHARNSVWWHGLKWLSESVEEWP